MILIDGYHLLCQPENATSAHDFGELEQRLQAQGIQVSFFGTCAFTGKPSIEDMGNALGVAIRNLAVPQVDLISHSMGGLIVRSYLAGKQNASGVFTPPIDPQVRKWVSIATPNFGALLPPVISGFTPDAQSQELVPANPFLFDLATWNQNHDDLRGVDTAGIIGNAGGFFPFNGFSDGTVAVTSASMSFTLPDARTRVVPYCHGAGDLTSILGLGCNAPPLAKIQSDNPLSWSIIDSFLKGTSDWQSMGHSPSQDKILSQYGGILSQPRNSLDQPIGPIQDQTFATNPPLVGGYSVVIDKPGPRITSITSSQSALPIFSLAPGMSISIHGSSLDASTVTVGGQILTPSGTSSSQVDLVLPNNVSGLIPLTVRNNQGVQTVNLMVVSNPVVSFTGSLPHLATGGTWDTVFYLLGVGPTPAQMHLGQFTDNGNPLSTTLKFLQQTGPSASLVASFIDRTLSQNSLLIVDSTGLDNQAVQTGSAQLAAAGRIDGFAIFHFNASGQEAVVPLETRNAPSYLVAFDNTNGVFTGIAVENVAASAANIPVVIRDDNGALIATSSIFLPGSGHASFVLSAQFSGTANKRGTIEFDTPSGGQIGVVGIRYTPPGTLTTIPALAGVGTAGGSIAHLASANGWETTFVLVNTGSTAAQAHLKFFDNDGNPLPLPLAFPQGGAATVSATLDQTIAANATLWVRSTGAPGAALKTGSAQLTADGTIGGFEIFRWTTFGQEASVPFETRAPNSFLLVYDNTGGLTTGVALANNAMSAASITARIYDDTGALLQTATLNLVAHGHASFLLPDPASYPITANKRGIVEFVVPAGGSVSVIGLRAKSDGTLTTIPVLTR